MRKRSVIYQIMSIISRRIYIGSAKDYIYRVSLHINDLKKNDHHNIILQNHFNKYGIDDLKFSVLEEVENTDYLLIREQYFIDKLNPAFNICKKAGSQLGTKRTEETKLKMSKARIGNKYAVGSKRSDEWKAMISVVNTGKKRTDEQKLNISLGSRGKGKASKHIKYIKENTGIKTQLSLAAELGVTQSAISKLLKEWA